MQGDLRDAGRTAQGVEAVEDVLRVQSAAVPGEDEAVGGLGLVAGAAEGGGAARWARAGRRVVVEAVEDVGAAAGEGGRLELDLLGGEPVGQVVGEGLAGVVVVAGAFAGQVLVQGLLGGLLLGKPPRRMVCRRWSGEEWLSTAYLQAPWRRSAASRGQRAPSCLCWASRQPHLR
ncbi:hypothetical protein A6A07_29620 [Streptomyces sp. CB03911]|nr:hypothetical protein A6A07_29620 [Streptomyces sp. CB03911]